MKKKLCLTISISLSIFFCYGQKNSQPQKKIIYLKKYETNGVAVEIPGYNKGMEFIPDGKVNTFYTNKLKALEGAFKDGEPVGNWNLYYASGKMKASAVYNKGVLHGITKTYYDDGTLAAEIPYEKGHIEGIARYYDKRGKKKAELTYKKKKIVRIVTLQMGHTVKDIVYPNFDGVKMPEGVINLKFDRICEYDQHSKLTCLTVDEFTKRFLQRGFAEEFIAELLAEMQKMWDDLGLKGNVFVQCGNGALGVSDVGNVNQDNSNNTGIPDINSQGNNSFKKKVDNACTKAALDSKTQGSNTNNPGSGGIIGPNGISPQQGLIDNAKAKMDEMVKNCKEDKNDMIENSLRITLSTIYTIFSVIKDIRGAYIRFKGEKISESPDVYRLEQGVYQVYENGVTFRITRGEDHVITILVQVGSGQGAMVQHCTKYGEAINCSKVEIYDIETGWNPCIGCPEKLKTDEDINKVINSVSMAAERYINDLSEGKSGEYLENNFSKCDQITGGIEKLRTECEQSGWKTFRCIEFVRMANNCPADLTVAKPTPDGDLYFGCSTGDKNLEKEACERKKWIWAENPAPEGVSSPKECLNKDDITRAIDLRPDPCGPEMQPTNETGCNPVTNIPPERGPVPSPQGNPISNPLFKNNKFRTFEDYIQHNQFMLKQNLKNLSSPSTYQSNQLSDINYSEKTIQSSENVIIVFYSQYCQPSLNYLAEIHKNLKSLEKKAAIYITDIEQNPELNNQYDIRFTPTTVVLKKGKVTKVFSGANKINELKNIQ